jgi:hypothetical protein
MNDSLHLNVELVQFNFCDVAEYLIWHDRYCCTLYKVPTESVGSVQIEIFRLPCQYPTSSYNARVTERVVQLG